MTLQQFVVSKFASGTSSVLAKGFKSFRGPTNQHQTRYLPSISIRSHSRVQSSSSSGNDHHQGRRRRLRGTSLALTQIEVSPRLPNRLFYSTGGHGSSTTPLFDPSVLPSSMTLLKQDDDELSLEELNLKKALKEYLRETSTSNIQSTDDETNQGVTSNVHPSQSAMEELQRAYMDLGYWEESLKLEQYKCAVYLESDTDEYADSIHAQGKFYLRLEDFQSSQRLYQEALQYFESSGNTVQRGHVLISMAGWYFFRNQLNEALESLTRSETLLDSNPALLVKCLDNQGLIYRLWGEFDTALNKYQQALQVVVDRDTEWALRLHVGDMFIALEDPMGALEVYEDLLEETTAVSNEQQKHRQQQPIERIMGMQGVLMHNIATIHVDQGDYDQAMEEFRQALRLKKSAPGGEHNPEVAKTLNSMGALYAGVFDEKMHALECFQQALLIARIHAVGDPQTDPDVQAALQNIATMEQALHQGEQKNT